MPPIRAGLIEFDEEEGTPLLTTLVEVTEKEPKVGEAARADARVEVLAVTSVAEGFSGVIVPSTSTEAFLMKLNVTASIRSDGIPSRIRSFVTIESMLPRTKSTLAALRVILKPTLRLLWHFQFVLV